MEPGVSLAGADVPGPTHVTADGFAGRVRHAVAWRWGTQFVAQIVTWTSTILVVRLLEPSDYGLFAMAQVVLTALHFLNGHSFASSLVQAEDVSERQVGQVFGLLLLLNGTLAIVQFALAPQAAAYFTEPLVADMLRVQALLFLFVPFTALPAELLARRLEFRRQGQVTILAAVIGAVVALALAWLGFGVWALVYAPIAMFGVRAVGMTIAAGLLVKPVFDFRGARDLIAFGGTLTACQLFWIIQSQSDIVIAGRQFTPYDLGLYSEALFLTLIVTGRFLPPINEVAFPAYAELHRAGRPLGPYFLRTAQLVMLVAAPIYIGLALTAQDAVATLFGSKWLGLVPIVQGLALAMPAMALHFICSPTTNAMGRPRIYLLTSIAGAIIMPVAFLWGHERGAMGLVEAWWIAAPLLLAFTLSLTLPQIGVRPIELAGRLVPVALACGVMALAVTLAGLAWQTGSPFFNLVVQVPIGVLAYLLTLRLFWPRLVSDVWALLRTRQISPPG